jgi:Flp pilus assembly protein TadD
MRRAGRRSGWTKRTVLGAALGVLASALLLAAGWLAWTRRQPVPAPADDPRLSYPTPYRNVHPDVHYVGDAACALCHTGHAATYVQHPMGRTLAPLTQAPVLERFDRSAHDPFEAAGFRFTVTRRQGHVFHEEVRPGAGGRPDTASEAEVAYVIGSGAHARSYLIDRGGYLFQSAITWYSQKAAWDLSPGFAANPHSDRPITAECLFCHCNHADAVEGTVNRYRPPIFHGFTVGCERCHGPGELHVRLRERDEVVPGADDTIVNPARLEPALREAVCQQCHLQGQKRILRRGRGVFDYRPGLPLHLFWSVFVQAPGTAEGNKAVGQVEQLSASRCFQASAGKLGCVSCHDAHELPPEEKRLAYYRGRCLACHTDESCSASPAARRQQNDHCTACHMPRIASSDVAHTAMSDHRIPRRAGTVRPSATPSQADGPLVYFHENLVDPDDPEVARDRGLAHVRLAEFGSADRSARRQRAATALPLLDAAVRRAPDDGAAWEAKGYALWLLDRKEEALADLDHALALAPGREETLLYRAALLGQLGRHEAAIDTWRRALSINPWPARYHYELAKELTLRQEWQQAVAESRAARERNPFHLEARQLLVASLLQLGDKAEARSEFDRLLALGPPDADSLRRWFGQQLR